MNGRRLAGKAAHHQGPPRAEPGALATARPTVGSAPAWGTEALDFLAPWLHQCGGLESGVLLNTGTNTRGHCVECATTGVDRVPERFRQRSFGVAIGA